MATRTISMVFAGVKNSQYENNANSGAVGHGGNVDAASARYGIAVEQWIDLSTATNPESYPLCPIEPQAFQRLPYLRPALAEQAAAFYGSAELLPVPGTQAAIQHLPHCLESYPVLVPATGYQEHAFHWRQAGVDVTTYPAFELAAAENAIDAAIEENPRRHIVVINPNNPTGLRFSAATLAGWAQRLATDAYLIIDEAFMDTSPAASVLHNSLSNNMIVLRSFGKFFGLAGIRLGFVFANKTVLAALSQRLGPWAVNGPAQCIAIAALKDHDWVQQARGRIDAAAEHTQKLFAPLFRVVEPVQTSHEMLFSSYLLGASSAQQIQQQFAQQGILLRLIEVNAQHSLLRAGLVSEQQEAAVCRVEQAVDDYVNSHSA